MCIKENYLHSSIRIPLENLKSVKNQVVWMSPPVTMILIALGLLNGFISDWGDNFIHVA